MGRIRHKWFSKRTRPAPACPKFRSRILDSPDAHSKTDDMLTMLTAGNVVVFNQGLQKSAETRAKHRHSRESETASWDPASRPRNPPPSAARAASAERAAATRQRGGWSTIGNSSAPTHSIQRQSRWCVPACKHKNFLGPRGMPGLHRSTGAKSSPWRLRALHGILRSATTRASTSLKTHFLVAAHNHDARLGRATNRYAGPRPFLARRGLRSSSRIRRGVRSSGARGVTVGLQQAGRVWRLRHGMELPRGSYCRHGRTAVVYHAL